MDRRSTDTASVSNRVVESVGYYSNLLQTKIDAIVNEIGRLRTETEMADGDSEVRLKAERDFEEALKEVRMLEGELGDYNMANEYIRSGPSNEDLQNSVIDIMNHNMELEEEIDVIFLNRKKTEDEVAKCESEMKEMEAAMERKILQSNADKIYKFQAAINEINAVHKESKRQEEQMAEFRHKTSVLESHLEGQGLFVQMKQFRKQINDIKQQIVQVEEDIQLVQMDEDDGREHLLQKVKGLQQQIKLFDEKTSLVQSEITDLQKEQLELRSELRMKSRFTGPDGAKALEHLFMVDKDISRSLEAVPETKSKLVAKQVKIKSTIEALLEDMSKNIFLTEVKLPSKGEMNMLKQEVAFKNANIDANQETISRLEHQKKARMEEVRVRAKNGPPI